MRNRVLMAKFDPSYMITGHDPGCTCGASFEEGEIIALYPMPEVDDRRIRDMVCLTCHFWFVHEVMNAL